MAFKIVIKLLLNILFIKQVITKDKTKWYQVVQHWAPQGYIMTHDIKFQFTDNMSDHEKQTIIKLMEHLMKDTDLRMRQILHIRRKHQASVQFNVGLLVGKIRDQYRTMMDNYREAVDYRVNRMYFQPPGIFGKFYEHYFHYQEYIRRNEITIEQYIRVLEKIPESDMNAEAIMVSQSVQAFEQARRQNDLDRKALEKLVDEERLKQRMRQQFLMRRLGLPSNMTTPKKRFQNQWPVRQTWEENFEKMY